MPTLVLTTPSNPGTASWTDSTLIPGAGLTVQKLPTTVSGVYTLTFAGAGATVAAGPGPNEATVTVAGGGGGGGIGGTIAAGEVAFGTGVDTIGGDANFTYNGTQLIVATGGSTIDIGQGLITGGPNLTVETMPGGTLTLGTAGETVDIIGLNILVNSQPGNPGDVLTSNGLGVAPTWQPVSGGGTTGSVTTTDATPTTMITLTPAADSTAVYEADVAAKKQGNAAGAGYKIIGSFMNQGGTVYQIGSTQVVAAQETIPSLDTGFVVSGGNVLLQVTGESAPVEISPAAVPPPSGATLNVPATYATIDLALAAAANGDLILVAAGTYTIASTIVVSKSVTIQGAGIAATFVDTQYSNAAPTVMFQVTVSNVVIRDMCIRHRKTSNTSVESAVQWMIANNGTAAGSSGHYLEAVRIEYMEFAILIRSDGWQINNCDFAYVGGNNSTRRAVGLYRSAGQGLFCNSTYDSGQTKVYDSGTSTGGNGVNTLNDTTKTWAASQWVGYTVTITGGLGNGQTRTVSANTPTQLTVSANWATTPDNTSTYSITATGNTRIVQVTSTTGTAEEILGGYLRLSNLTPVPAYPVQQLMNTDWFGAAPSKLQLVVDTCTTNETSAFVVFATTSAQPPLTRLASVLLKNNTLANSSGKGAFALDGIATVSSTAVASATTFTLTAATAWTINAYVGQTVTILTGTGAGQLRTIVGNTATTLSVSAAWSVTPDNTSTFAIATLASAGNTSFYASGNALGSTVFTSPWSSGVTPSGGAAIDALLGYNSSVWNDPNQPVSNPLATTWDWTGTVHTQTAP